MAVDELRLLPINGIIPGTTLRLDPGDTLRILYDNQLSFQPEAASSGDNEYHKPDHSNLHFQGGHVSGQLPSEDIRMIVEPGDSYQYAMLFPRNHIPGNHWYRPHVHRSSFIQVGGGVQGALIVNDPNDFLPTQVADATDIILFVKQISQRTLENVANQMNDEMLEINISRGAENVFRIVNGQYQPVLKMQPGEWQRWRIAYANLFPDKLNLRFYQSSSCEIQLLAKDGVYIHDYPRAVDMLPIPTSGRADVIER